jgi:adenosylcobinamide kinase / adenosylcobinamide-phosphate guanylyltransferase
VIGSLLPFPFSAPGLTLVIGGARSGKSRLAEGLARECGRPRHYIATAEAWDDEMARRIAAHRTDRGTSWTTHEAPRDLATPLSRIDAKAVVLIDCATLWLSNHLLSDPQGMSPPMDFLQALRAATAPVIVVTNEVGQGIVPENALARRFRDDQGRLNQALAAKADLVVAVIAGLPLVLKGAPR